MKTIMLSDEELKARGITLIKENRIIQPESKIVHKYLDGLKGIEIGAAADNPYGVDAVNVATEDETDRAFYKGIQLVVCGGYVEIDVHAEADKLPFEDNTQDFVLASHVLEHLKDPIGALLEWNRVVRDGGYIALVVPKKDGPYGDAGRQISPRDCLEKAYYLKWTDEQALESTPDKNAQPRLRGHIWVFSLRSLLELIWFCGAMKWDLIEAHETDDKDGLGHLVIYKVHK